MDERALQFRVGAMVVGTLFVAVLLLIVFNYSPSLLRGRDTIYIKFAQAPGVTQDTPIKKSGVLIGRVSDVTLRERDVLVTAKLDSKYTVYDGEICRIGSESLLGGAMIEFVAYSPDNLGQPLSDGALIEGSVEADALGTMEQASYAIDEIRLAAGEFRSFVAENREQAALVMQKSQDAADQISGAASNISHVADQWSEITTENEAQMTRLITKSETAMGSFQLAMDNINSLVGNEQMRADLQASLAGMPLLVAETRAAVSKYSAVADRADRSLAEAEVFAQSLGQLGESSQKMADNVDGITVKLDRLVLDLLTMSDAINKQEGTLGQLIYDPELYQRLNRAAGNVEQVSYRLRPIVEDVRVFTDKIARDPGQLGVRGALQRNSSRNKFFPFGGVLRGGTNSQSQPPVWGQPIPYEFHPMQPSTQPAPIYEQMSQGDDVTTSTVQPAAHNSPAPTQVPQRPQLTPNRPARTSATPTNWEPQRPTAPMRVSAPAHTNVQANTPEQFWRSR